jgi:gliding motility-associated-like protein
MTFLRHIKLIAVLFLVTSINLFSQNSNAPVLGICPITTQSNTPKLGDGLSVLNGTNTNQTSYTVSACGLDYVVSSRRLCQRGGAPVGTAQPAVYIVTGIPPCATIVKAFFYTGGSGSGPTINLSFTNPLAANGIFPMVANGFTATDKWGGYGGTWCRRADVTSLISGNGNYIISGIPTGFPNDPDGGTLIIIYSDNSQSFTGSMVLADGCQAAGGPGNLNSVISGFNVCANPTLTKHFIIVGDLQSLGPYNVRFNNLANNYVHATAAQQFYDYIPFTGSPVTAGQTTANYGLNNATGDAFAFYVAGLYYQTACNVCPLVASGLTVTPTSTSSCISSTATANVTGGAGPFTYTWAPGGQNTQVVNSLAPGTYTVFVSEPSTCKTGSAVITLTNTTTSTITVNSGTYCAGGSVNLVASGATNYTWSPGTSLNTINGPSVTANPTVTTIYTISSTNSVGCISTKTTQVTVNPTPTITTAGSTVCAGSTISLTANSLIGSSYNWTGPNGFNSVSQNPTITSASNLMSGVYNLTVTSALGCTNTAVANVTVIALPTPSITSNSPVCVNRTLTLVGSGGTSYNWSGPNGFASAISNPSITNVTAAASGIYTLIVSAGTCTASTTISVTINALPIPTLTSNSPICVGQNLNLSANGGVSYNWTGPSAFANATQNPTLTNVSVANGGTYSVVVTAANTCSILATIPITINSLPTVSATNTLVCVGQNINLNANSVVGATYAWTGPNSFTANIQNPVIANAQASLAGVYNVLATSVLGCTNTAAATVTVLALASPSITSNSPVCVNGTLNLSGSGGATYAWQGPNAFASANQNPSITNVSAFANGIYTLVISAGSCSASTTASIIINALPVPTLTSNSPICVGQGLNLAANGAVTYNWTGPNAFASAVQNPTITNAVTSNGGTYSVVLTAANTCSILATIPITINSLPTVSATSTLVCLGQNININANSVVGATYFWTGPNSYTSNIQNSIIANAQASLAGVYNVIATSVSGCTNTAALTVTIAPLPTPNIASNSPVCVNSPLNLNGSGGTTYAWLGPNAFASVLQNPSINNVSALANGVYTLLVSSGTCSASTTATITINALPLVIINNAVLACQTKPFNLTASGGVTYSWTGPNGFNSTQQNPSIASAALTNSGVYNVVVTNANTCSASAQTTVTVNANPVITTISNVVCIGTTATLNANGANSYSWIGPNNFSSVQQSPLVTNVSNLSVGVYTVIGTALNTCTNMATASIGILSLPTPSINSNAPVCLNTKLNLQGSGGINYSWTGPNNFTSSLQNPSITVISNAYMGVYTLRVTDANGCANTIALPVVINPLPTGTLVSNVAQNCVPFCADFNVLTASPLQSINWINSNGGVVNGNGLTKCFTTDGDYNFTASFTDGNGCSNTASFVVTAYPKPAADFVWNPSVPLEDTEPTQFKDITITGGPIVEWRWMFINDTYTSNLQSPSFLFVNVGTYPVAMTVKNKWGCMDTVVNLIKVAEDYGLYIPNAFTPNGDGTNDFFQPKGYGVTKYTLTIFDRWGEKLFVTTEFAKGWDGNFKGQPCKEEVYVYKVTLTNSFGKAVEKTGHVTLTR